jgi:hypothetical protein
MTTFHQRRPLEEINEYLLEYNAVKSGKSQTDVSEKHDASIFRTED